MADLAGLRLTENALLGLFYITRYRFLTIAQFARLSGMHYNYTSELLKGLTKRGVVGFFGHTSIPGQGTTPKAFYLRRKGWEILRAESGIPEEFIGSFVEVHKETSWSPQMYHRLRLLDCFIALEVQVRERPHLNLVKTLLEYRRVRRGGRIARETTDFVAKEETAENRIIPDGAFVLENVETEKRALFFVEMDMATERIISKISHDRRMSLHFKFEQYDKYLQSLRFSETYATFGTFGHFTLLFVTIGEGRLANTRQALSDLPEDLHDYYRFAVFEEAAADFLGPVWFSRSPTDTQRYRLTRN
jgi:Replication-relaxation